MAEKPQSRGASNNEALRYRCQSKDASTNAA